MRRPATLPLRHRLTLVMTLTSGLAVLVAAAGLLAFEAARAYGRARTELASLAEVVGANSAAALAFGDPEAAQETLEALRRRPDIVCAGLYDARGRPFAGYCGGEAEGRLPGAPGGDGFSLQGRALVLVQAVAPNGDRAGTVLLRSSLDPMAGRLREYALTVLVMTLLAMGAALILSARLQRTVSHPILMLAETARAVGGDGDYSRRAPRLGEDELGVLTADFNAMLAHIQEQDAALRAARDALGLAVAAQQEDLRHESAGRRRAEELARERDERLRLQEAALAATVDAVVITDREGTIEWVNPSFTRLTGWAPEEAIGRTPRILKSGAQPREFYEALWRTLLQGRVWCGELTNRRKDGSLYTEEMTITPVPDESGRVAHFAAIKRDISERLALQARLHAARKLEALGQLAGGVAHDFNNLLGVVRGYGELLMAELADDDGRREEVQHILEASDRAARLVRQLLAFGRRQVLEPRVVCLNAVIADVEKLIRRLVGETVEVDVVPGADLGRVRVDPTQIDQVLLNLATNARHAMPRGGRLTIETSNAGPSEAECRADGGGRPGTLVRLRVSDTGVGMDEATRSRIFEPFFTTKDVGEGSGLGLATVYGIVEQSGGQIRVDSAPGRGSSFEILLPRVDGEVEAREAPPLPPARLTAATILLVEDEKSLRDIATELLEASGYTVITAANGAEALTLVERHAVDGVQLLLTDVVMPGMSGPALARRVRERWPEVSVLYMSGYSDEAVRKQGLLDPGTRLLAKPFSRATLVASVEDALA